MARTILRSTRPVRLAAGAAWAAAAVVFGLLEARAALAYRTLHADLAVFVEAGRIEGEAMRAFFAREAQEAGVRRIRPMTPGEKPVLTHPAQSGCGLARGRTREILVDADRVSCINLANLAHEIAHFRAFREGCTGHGPEFYRLNGEIAARFEAAFPGRRWGSRRPVSAVEKRSREYRTPC